MPDVYADIVASAALLLAFVSLGWQVTRSARWDRPRLTVVGLIGYGHETDGRTGSKFEGWMLSLTVTNVGDVATRILDVYWEFEFEDQTTLRVRGSEIDGNLEYESNGVTRIRGGVLDPALPLLIGRNDSFEWLFMRSIRSHAEIAKVTRGRPTVIYVSRKRSRTDSNPHQASAVGDWQPRMREEALAEIRKAAQS